MHRVETPEGLRRLLVQPSSVVGPPPGPRDVDLGEIHRRVALDDPFGERLAGTRAEDDSLRVEPGGDPEAWSLRELAEMEVRVRREALRTTEIVFEADVPQDGQPFTRVGEDRREVLPVLAELHEPAGVDVAGRLRLAFRLEGADQEPAAVVPDVEVPVQVAQDRELFVGDRRLVGHDPHVLRGVQGDGGAGEPRKLGGPQAGREHGQLALDRASVGGDARDPSVAPLETGHADTEHEPRAAVLVLEALGGAAVEF